MNRQFALALVLAAGAAGNAFADDITVETTPFASTATRAGVAAQLDAFRSSGTDPWAIEYNPLARLRSARTRAQVTAEYIAGRDEVAAFAGEDSGSSYLAQNVDTGATATRVAGQPGGAQ